MKRWHVVAYDVADARRLRRVHRCVSRHALAVQRSVFLFHGSAHSLRRLLIEIEGLIDAEHDDVRTYPSAHPGRMWMSSGIKGIATSDDNYAVEDTEAALFAATGARESTTFLYKLWRRLGGTR